MSLSFPRPYIAYIIDWCDGNVNQITDMFLFQIYSWYLVNDARCLDAKWTKCGVIGIACFLRSHSAMIISPQLVRAVSGLDLREWLAWIFICHESTKHEPSEVYDAEKHRSWRQSDNHLTKLMEMSTLLPSNIYNPQWCEAAFDLQQMGILDPIESQHTYRRTTF